MKVLIVDDEKPACERLINLLATMPDYQACGAAGNGVEALQMAQIQHPDIVLMDIRMPGMDGLEAARHLIHLKEPPAIIFTTAYGEHALEAFETHATDYLLKPVRKERLEQALRNARNPNRAQLAGLAQAATGTTRTHLCARLGEKLKLIPIEQVIYFLADQKYVTVCNLQGEVLIEDSLKSLESELADRVLRIHRNALVGTAHLVGLERTPQGRYQVILQGSDARLEVSRRHLAAIKHFLRTR
jgi:two-component system response regulator AlgR